MIVKIFSSRLYEKENLTKANSISNHQLFFEPELLSIQTIEKTKGADVVSIFTNDDLNAETLEGLYQNGVRYIAIRAAGYNNVDIAKAKQLGIAVANVPEYSPYAVAEHTVALILALNRKLLETNKRVLKNNFTLDGLEGFDINGKTVGVIGLGKIGGVVAKIMSGFGCKLLAYDVLKNPVYTEKYGVTYTSLESLLENSDIITLHAPLNKETQYLLDKEAFHKMKPNVMIVNTGRGALLNTQDAINALKSGKIGYLGLDVYEKEKGVFFYDHSEKGIQDSILEELIKLPNVLVTPHMSFLTSTALKNIADTTIENIDFWQKKKKSPRELT